MTGTSSSRYLVLLGGPGAGKGTQADRLTALLGIPHLASGDVFRTARQEDSELGALVRSYYDKGQLVPDDVTIEIMLSALAREPYAQGAMLDGFPRTLEQARALDGRLDQAGKPLWKVLYLRVAPEELLQRISGRWLCRSCSAVYNALNDPPRAAGVCDRCGGVLYQRVDDAPETAKARLATFFSETEPLVAYYRDQSKLCEVNGEQSVDAVAQELEACVTGGH